MEQRFNVAFFAPGVQLEGGRWFFKTSPILRALTLPALEQCLSTPRSRPEDKRGAAAWSPTLYPDGATRRKAAVIHVSCLVLDYDTGATADDIADKWGAYLYFAHTSYSHTPASPRYRVVLPLASPVEAQRWAAVWEWAEARDPRIDKACKDQSRVYFLPVECEEFAAWRNDGPLLDLAHVQSAPPRPKPAPTAFGSRGGRRYDTDPAAREQAGIALGGKVGDESIKGVRCPQCGRPSVWWPISPQSFSGWMCQHRNSCGAKGSISKLLE